MTALIDDTTLTALQAQAPDCESARRLPDASADLLIDAGVFRLLVPKSYGGAQAHPQDFFDTLAAIARVDGSIGWVSMIGATTGMLSASLPSEWAQRIYGDNPRAITTGVTAPIGRAEPVDGGLRVNGRWPWGSGSQVSQWICGGCLRTDQADGPPHPILVFFERNDVEIHDTWYAGGLRGTGSNDIEVRDLLVPEGRWVVLGSRARVEAPLYQFPTFGLLALGVSAVALGIAQRALEEFQALATAKTPTGSQRALASRGSAQEDYAQAEIDVRAAAAFTREAIGDAFEIASQGERLTRDIKATLRQAATNNTWSAVRAVDRLYSAAGGSSVFSEHPLQRCFRDVHVVTQHIMVARPTLEVVGKVRFGIDPKTPL